MVLVEREIMVTFTVTSNRTLTQLRTFCNNNIYPSMATKFNNAFSAFTTKSILVTNNAQIGQDNGATNIWQVGPHFRFSVDVTAARSDEAKEAWRVFIEDCRDSFKTLLNTLTGTTCTRIHYHTHNETTVEVVL